MPLTKPCLFRQRKQSSDTPIRDPYPSFPSSRFFLPSCRILTCRDAEDHRLFLTLLEIKWLDVNENSHRPFPSIAFPREESLEVPLVEIGDAGKFAPPFYRDNSPPLSPPVLLLSSSLPPTRSPHPPLLVS